MKIITLFFLDRQAEAKLSPSEDDSRKYILKEFAKAGKPPSEEDVAAAMNLLSVEAAHSK